MSKDKRENSFYNSPEAQELFIELYKGLDPNIGLYRPKDLSHEKATIATIDKMLKLIPRINKSTRILILGSGFGGSAYHILTTKECKVDCINLNSTQNEYNQKNILKLEEKLQKKFNLEEGHLEDIPYPLETFDIVIAHDVLSQSEDKLRIFREVHRTLKPEGRFVFTDLLKNKDTSIDDNQANQDLLPVEEIYSISKYEKLARKSFMHKVYLLELPEHLKIHYKKLQEDLAGKASKLKKKVDKDALAQYSEDIDNWVNISEKDQVDWGIFIFQKLND